MTLSKRIANAHDDSIWTIAWNAKDGKIYTGSVDETIKAWHPESGQVEKTLEGHQLGILSLDIHHNGTLAASSALDANLRIWDLTTGSTVRTLPAGPIEAWTLACHPQADLLVAGTHAGGLSVYNTSTGVKEASVTHPQGKFSMSVAMSGSGRHAATGMDDGKVALWDIVKAKEEKLTPWHIVHDKPIRAVHFSPTNTNLIFVASDDKKITVYDTASNRNVWSFVAHTNWVTCLDIAQSGQTFASGSSDKKVKTWSMTGRSCIDTFTESTEQIWTMAFSPDDKQLAVGGDAGDVLIYDM